MEDGEIVEGVAMEEDGRGGGGGGGGGEAQLPEYPPKIEKSPYESLQETKSSVEELVSQILSVKQQNSSKSQLREHVTQMFLNFIVLRQVNRSILLEEDRVKAETEKAKAPVDFTTLQLHNLMYEKSHYVKAIKACKDFKSKYPDIELVDEDEFFREAPENIKGSVLSEDNSHNLMLKRLNFELHQRKELCKLQDVLEQKKKGLLETIANRKKFLSSLPSHLKSLKKASLPVQNQLGVLHTKKLKQYNSAELLPPPLYVIYSQLLAQKEAFGEAIDLEMVGSLKDAQTFARQQAAKETGISANGESSKMEDDVPDEEEDGQRRRKRPRRVPSKENLEQTGLYQAHPLKVTLHIYDETSDSKSAKLITLKFEYLFKLNVICVGVEGSSEGPDNNILCNLFPGDSGVELPHQSAKLVVGDKPVFDESRTSRPYKWAQHLAGIDFLPEIAPLLSSHETSSSETVKSDVVLAGLSLYRQQNRIQTVVQRIRSRRKAQLALVEQLDSLKKLQWPSLKFGSVPWASHNPSCNLCSWSAPLPPPSRSLSLSTIDRDQGHESMDMDVDRRSGASKDESESAREDGELPSLVPVASGVNDVNVTTPSRVSNFEHSKQLSLMSKSTVSPINKIKSQSFKKYDEDLDLLLDTDSDLDEHAQIEVELENADSVKSHEIAERAWVSYGVKEYTLVLARKMEADGKDVKLEAKIKIGMEYPLRPPLFAVNLSTTRESHEESYSKWYNELRAMEAEVNLYLLKMLPLDQENYTLAHQVYCLAMLFDYMMDESSSPSAKSTSIVDIGLCKPVSGRLLSRAFRGRDRRKMLSWKDIGCTSGYPN